MNPVAVLDRGSSDKVREEASEILKAAAGGGGFIMMPGCDHPPSVPEENLKTLYETAKNYKY